MHLVYTKSATYDTRDVSIEARIPSMYFAPQPDNFENTRIYIPSDYFVTARNKLTVSITNEGDARNGRLENDFSFIELNRNEGLQQ